MKRLFRSFVERAVVRLGRANRLDVLGLAYETLGVSPGASVAESGEERFARGELASWLAHFERPVVFDVGANNGEFTKLVQSALPGAAVWAFEPSRVAFETLERSVGEGDVHCFRLGLGRAAGPATLYNYSDRPGSAHGSTLAPVFSRVHGAEGVAPEEIAIVTLDEFCDDNDLSEIHFLKVDTEGSELSVLEGGRRMITSGNVHIVQFEFNEMNIVSRTFLSDFYDLLPGFRFYRIAPHGLISLGSYDARNEIFRYQNIAAVSDRLFS